MEGVEQEASRPSILTRFVALIILAVAAWVLLKIVIGVVASMATIVVVVLAVIGVIWALSKF